MKETLNKHSQGGQVLEALKNEVFPSKERKRLIRIVVAELVATQSSYPPHEAKLALAKALVTEFPSLKNDSSKLGFVSIALKLSNVQYFTNVKYL